MNTNRQLVKMLLLSLALAIIIQLPLQTATASTASEEEEGGGGGGTALPSTTEVPISTAPSSEVNTTSTTGDSIRTKLILFGIQGTSDIVTWVSSANISAAISGNVSAIDMGEDNQTNGVGSVYITLRGVGPQSGVPVEGCAVQIGVNQVTCDSTFMTGTNTTNVLQIPLTK